MTRVDIYAAILAQPHEGDLCRIGHRLTAPCIDPDKAWETFDLAAGAYRQHQRREYAQAGRVMEGKRVVAVVVPMGRC